MIGRHPSTMQRLGAAATLVSALFLAAPSPSDAATVRASDADRYNGAPCNDLCRIYMDWSDRVMAAFHPHPPPRPQQRTAAQPKISDRTPDKTPERDHGGDIRPVHRVAAVPAHHAVLPPRPPALKSFAQLPQRSEAAPHSVDVPQAETAAPATPIVERVFAAASNATASLADAGRAINESAAATPVSFTTPTFAAQAPGASEHRADGPDLRFVLSLVLVLSLCTWLAVRYRGRSRGRPRAASTFR